MQRACNGRTSTRAIAERTARRCCIALDVALDEVEDVVAFFASSGLLSDPPVSRLTP